MTQDAGQNGAVETAATDWAALAQAFRAREVQDLGPWCGASRLAMPA